MSIYEKTSNMSRAHIMHNSINAATRKNSVQRKVLPEPYGP